MLSGLFLVVCVFVCLCGVVLLNVFARCVCELLCDAVYFVPLVYLFYDCVFFVALCFVVVEFVPMCLISLCVSFVAYCEKLSVLFVCAFRVCGLFYVFVLWLNVFLFV